MSLLKKLSNVIKEVFWIKTKPSSKSSKSTSKKSKKTNKKPVKKTLKTAVKKPLALSKKKEILKVEKVKVIPKPKVEKKSKGPQLDPNLVKVGEITHYFDRIKVTVVKITQGTILVGDKLTIVGQKSKFIQKVWSMQIESLDVKIAKKGQLIGLKVDKPVAVGDVVYK